MYCSLHSGLHTRHGFVTDHTQFRSVQRRVITHDNSATFTTLFEEVLVLFDCVLSNGIQGGFLGGFNLFPGIVKKKNHSNFVFGIHFQNSAENNAQLPSSVFAS